MTALEVLDVRVRAAMQDLGRAGLAHLGVPRAGAADRTSLRHANALVGNTETAAAVEIVIGGLRVRCAGDVTAAVVGADWSVDGAQMPALHARDIAAGSTITVGAASGVYAYLAVAGGFDVVPTLGSRSSDTLSGIGPVPLAVGDVLPVGTRAGRTTAVEPIEPQDGPLRVVPGPRDDWFDASALDRLLSSEWTVTPQSDRVGLRLSGPTLDRSRHDELPSEGMVPGAIQVPPDGQPIVFLANHPATGGYPVLAVVVTPDVDRAAQHRPGARLRFCT
ncbi:MAG: biotin-dependent carboxyltransferase family protein [Actinomycetes bacterium]